MACGIQIYFFIFPLSPCSISDFHMYQRIEVGQEVFFFFFFHQYVSSTIEDRTTFI
jgi:hypothetical protein